MIEKQPPRHAQRKVVDDKHERAFARDIAASQEPAQGRSPPRAVRGRSAKSSTGLEPVAGRSVWRPVIRYLALAFIFFQVATTTALATQVVLFEDQAARIAAPSEPASGPEAQPSSPQAPKIANRPETREPEHLLIQIDCGITS
ncbi:hypothetical protein MPLSOD_40704 [Mesorhizobium sp. SOD10]|nr:hypothetical protein MPLSOD_40704 [Mesorhizobium sp. SOD10]